MANGAFRVPVPSSSHAWRCGVGSVWRWAARGHRAGDISLLGSPALLVGDILLGASACWGRPPRWLGSLRVGDISLIGWGHLPCRSGTSHPAWLSTQVGSPGGAQGTVGRSCAAEPGGAERGEAETQELNGLFPLS